MIIELFLFSVFFKFNDFPSSVPCLRRASSVEEEYEAAGGEFLLNNDDDDNDGWLATHGMPKG